VNERRRVFFSGQVQGVGFRLTAVRVARSFAVTGWVRNLADRRVELVAEGTAAELEAFLAALSQQMAGYVRSIDQRTEPATGEFPDFGIAPSAAAQ
jgi:acylphosphatase